MNGKHRSIYTLLVTLLPTENFGVPVSERCKTFTTFKKVESRLQVRSAETTLQIENQSI